MLAFDAARPSRRVAGGDQFIGQSQTAAENQRLATGFGIEIRVARTHRQPVRFADDWADANFDRQIKIFDQSPHHQRLLIILAPEECHVGLDHIEQLQHDRGYTPEVPWATLPLERQSRAFRFDMHGVTRPIDLVRRRREHQVGAMTGKRRQIDVERARVFAKIFVGANCVGLTKIVTTVNPQRAAEASTRLTCPACKAPIVGTSPIDLPSRRAVLTAGASRREATTGGNRPDKGEFNGMAGYSQGFSIKFQRLPRRLAGRPPHAIDSLHGIDRRAELRHDRVRLRLSQAQHGVSVGLHRQLNNSVPQAIHVRHRMPGWVEQDQQFGSHDRRRRRFPEFTVASTFLRRQLLGGIGQALPEPEIAHGPTLVVAPRFGCQQPLTSGQEFYLGPPNLASRIRCRREALDHRRVQPTNPADRDQLLGRRGLADSRNST